MDEPQQPPAAPRAHEDQEHSGGISRGKTIALWAGVAALLLALLGSLMIVLKSLQADRTLAQISKSANTAVIQASAPPAVLPLPAPVPPPALAPQGQPSSHSPAPAVPPASRPVRVEKTQPAPAKPARRTEAPAQAKAVREPRMTRASVERRLAQCKEYAGEAAAACFRRACSSYAKRAPICINDEPAARR
ncbi:hypothetical protein [Pseudoduganella rhizocola]|uniref:hypothetical protein n=1 Tax=Pseudoduganella rhizocola TaxID=3382643 RepID=UPI0038B436EE